METCAVRGRHNEQGVRMQNIFDGMTAEASEQVDDWQIAEDALKAARKMMAGPERIVALKRAGQLRFDAYERKLAIQASMGGENERLRCGHPPA